MADMDSSSVTHCICAVRLRHVCHMLVDGMRFHVFFCSVDPMSDLNVWTSSEYFEDVQYLPHSKITVSLQVYAMNEQQIVLFYTFATVRTVPGAFCFRAARPCVRDHIQKVCWQELINRLCEFHKISDYNCIAVQLRIKMNWLDFEEKRSKINII